MNLFRIRMAFLTSDGEAHEAAQIAPIEIIPAKNNLAVFLRTSTFSGADWEFEIPLFTIAELAEALLAEEAKILEAYRQAPLKMAAGLYSWKTNRTGTRHLFSLEGGQRSLCGKRFRIISERPASKTCKICDSAWRMTLEMTLPPLLEIETDSWRPVFKSFLTGFGCVGEDLVIRFCNSSGRYPEWNWYSFDPFGQIYRYPKARASYYPKLEKADDPGRLFLKKMRSKLSEYTVWDSYYQKWILPTKKRRAKGR